MINFAELDFNEEFAYAFEALENTGQHMFITGKAGTGKSTFCSIFVKKQLKMSLFLPPQVLQPLISKAKPSIHFLILSLT